MRPMRLAGFVFLHFAATIRTALGSAETRAHGSAGIDETRFELDPVALPEAVRVARERESRQCAVAPRREERERLPALPPRRADRIGALEDHKATALAAEEGPNRQSRLTSPNDGNVDGVAGLDATGCLVGRTVHHPAASRSSTSQTSRPM